MTTLYIGVLATAFAFWAVVEANPRLPATTTSNAMLAVPVVGLTVSACVTGEKMDFWLIFGMLMMLAGIAIVAQQGGNSADGVALHGSGAPTHK